LSLEKVESTLREHPDVSDAGVTSKSNRSMDFKAYLVLKSSDQFQKCTWGYSVLNSY
jgi:acyl-CoA synthetase